MKRTLIHTTKRLNVITCSIYRQRRSCNHLDSNMYHCHTIVLFSEIDLCELGECSNIPYIFHCTFPKKHPPSSVCSHCLPSTLYPLPYIPIPSTLSPTLYPYPIYLALCPLPSISYPLPSTHTLYLYLYSRPFTIYPPLSTLCPLPLLSRSCTVPLPLSPYHLLSTNTNYPLPSTANPYHLPSNS